MSLRLASPLMRNALAASLLTILNSCGAHSAPKKKAAANEASQQDAAATTASAFSCAQEKTPSEFMTTLTQDLFRRGPTDDELKMAKDPAFSPAKAVDYALGSPEINTGVAYFISNLFRLEQNLKIDPNSKDPNAAVLVADLKQEPVILVQRNLDKPWPWFFTTQDIYCSANTATLYGFPVDANISGFVACKMNPERAGFLGLVSILRAFPSAFYLTNSNRHRVALAMYLAQGMQLAAATNGPTGEGRPLPLAECVPGIDQRVSSTGEVFGTAAVPLQGQVCSGCHVHYLAPLEPAFVRFNQDGSLMQLTDIDTLKQADTQGVSTDVLKDIMMNSGSSCWNPEDPSLPPEGYNGLPGLGRLIAKSDKLDRALAIQIQQNLLNHDPDETAIQETIAGYQAGGKTLKAALRGYFTSDVYQCAKRGN